MRIVQFIKKEPAKHEDNKLCLGLQMPLSKSTLGKTKSGIGDIVELSKALLGVSGIESSIHLIRNWDKIKEKLERYNNS